MNCNLFYLQNKKIITKKPTTCIFITIFDVEQHFKKQSCKMANSSQPVATLLQQLSRLFQAVKNKINFDATKTVILMHIFIYQIIIQSKQLAKVALLLFDLVQLVQLEPQTVFQFGIHVWPVWRSNKLPASPSYHLIAATTYLAQN